MPENVDSPTLHWIPIHQIVFNLIPIAHSRQEERLGQHYTDQGSEIKEL